MLIIFLRNILTGVLWIKDADKKQNKLFTELSDIHKGEKSIKKKSLQQNVVSKSIK